jgi:hypothetical protein
MTYSPHTSRNNWQVSFEVSISFITNLMLTYCSNFTSSIFPKCSDIFSHKAVQIFSEWVCWNALQHPNGGRFKINSHAFFLQMEKLFSELRVQSRYLKAKSACIFDKHSIMHFIMKCGTQSNWQSHSISIGLRLQNKINCSLSEGNPWIRLNFDIYNYEISNGKSPHTLNQHLSLLSLN